MDAFLIERVIAYKLYLGIRVFADLHCSLDCALDVDVLENELYVLVVSRLDYHVNDVVLCAYKMNCTFGYEHAGILFEREVEDIDYLAVGGCVDALHVVIFGQTDVLFDDVFRDLAVYLGYNNIRRLCGIEALYQINAELYDLAELFLCLNALGKYHDVVLFAELYEVGNEELLL